MKVLTKIPLLLLSTLLLMGCSKDSDIDPIYLAANGVTIKCDATGMVGDTFEVKGVTYTIVDETLLREMVGQGADVSKVCTSRVTDMSEMFLGSRFNQDISSWDVINVTNMNQMFQASTFSRDISSWDVSNFTNMYGMFTSSEFNQPIGNWDVSRVTDMQAMFSGSPFNQDISSWNVGNVTRMGSMLGNSQFNQDLSGWNVVNVMSCGEFSMNTPQWVLPKPNFTNCDPN